MQSLHLLKEYFKVYFLKEVGIILLCPLTLYILNLLANFKQIW